MIDKLQAIEEHYKQLEERLSDPATLADMKLFAKLNKEYKDLGHIVRAFHEYKNITSNIQSAKDIIFQEKDEELKDMAREELESLTQKQIVAEDKLKMLLVPKDPEDSKNAIMEIRAGTGGDEASLFAGDLFRMYTYYIEQKGWKMEMVSTAEGTAGGFKEIIFEVKGENVYGTLKYEAGVHRVQRVPSTETQGRVHTSAATVIVMPEADELDVEVKESDIRKDTFCAGGHGGQSVNTTYSAVRLTHIPTGVIATCQDERSQIKNYDKALGVLRSRLYENELEKRRSKDAAKRKSLVSGGDR